VQAAARSRELIVRHGIILPENLPAGCTQPVPL
jgi:hypothetical protein